MVHPPGHPHAGEVRWVAFEGAIVRGVQGKPGRLLGISRDITDRKWRSRHWQSATRSSLSLEKLLWWELSLSTSAPGTCKFRRAMRLSTACLREPPRLTAPIGELEFIRMICHGWRRTSGEILMPGGVSTIATTVLSVLAVRSDGSRRAASYCTTVTVPHNV